MFNGLVKRFFRAFQNFISGTSVAITFCIMGLFPRYSLSKRLQMLVGIQSEIVVSARYAILDLVLRNSRYFISKSRTQLLSNKPFCIREPGRWPSISSFITEPRPHGRGCSKPGRWPSKRKRVLIDIMFASMSEQDTQPLFSILERRPLRFTLLRVRQHA